MKHPLILAAALSCCTASAQAERCAASLGEVAVLLGQLQLASHWRETTAGDGRPLLLRIDEGNGTLHMAFVKSEEGPWAEGPVRICRRERRVVAEMARGRMAVGQAANWLIRRLLQHDPSFEIHALASGRLRVSTAGWSGDFEPAAAER